MADCRYDETRVREVTEPQFPQQVQLHVSWSAASEVPVLPVNQFAAVLAPPTKNGPPDGVFIILGNTVPPIIVGDTPELKQRSIEAAVEAGLHVEVYGRYHLSRNRLNDLIEGLQAIADAYDASAKSGSGTETKE